MPRPDAPVRQPRGAPDAEDRLCREVTRREARKLRSRSEERIPFLGLRMFGMVGWSVAVPTLIGLAAGLYLDRAALGGGRVSWTLTLLIVGVIAGCLNAWHWVAREAGLDASDEQDEGGPRAGGPGAGGDPGPTGSGGKQGRGGPAGS